MCDGASSSNASSIRAQLRDLKDNVDKHRTEYASTGSSALAGVIDKANSLWQRGAKDDSRAGALDASLLNVTSGIGAEQAGNLDKATPTAFLHKLLMKYKFSTGNAIKWAELASDVAIERIHKQVPAVTFLLGKFEAPAKKEKKERKRKEQGPSEPLQTADNVDVAGLREVEEDKAQTARLRVLANALRRRPSPPKPMAASGASTCSTCCSTRTHSRRRSKTCSTSHFWSRTGGCRSCATTSARGSAMRPHLSPTTIRAAYTGFKTSSSSTIQRTSGSVRSGARPMRLSSCPSVRPLRTTSQPPRPGTHKPRARRRGQSEREEEERAVRRRWRKEKMRRPRAPPRSGVLTVRLVGDKHTSAATGHQALLGDVEGDGPED